YPCISRSRHSTFLKLSVMCFIMSVNSTRTVLSSDYHKLNLLCQFVIINSARWLMMGNVDNHHLPAPLLFNGSSARLSSSAIVNFVFPTVSTIESPPFAI